MNTEEVIRALSANGTEFSDEQKLILNTFGGIALLAVAGSGKTFTMTNLIAKRLMTGEISDASKILCTTFSKGGAEEFETRLNALLAAHRLPYVHVSTIHSACYRILSVFGVKGMNVLSDGEDLRYLREAAKKVDKSLGKMSQDDLMDVASTISMQINTLMTDDEIFNSSHWNLSIELEQYKDIRSEYVALKQNAGAVNFDDMLHFVYEWLCVNKYQPVIDWCRNTWHYFFIDEFQDTNPVQMEIIKVLVGNVNPSARIVVVGDDDQCVYEFRGTDPSILINISGTFDVCKRYLSTNYRCMSDIVEKASACVVNMSNREQKSMIANKAGGQVKVIDCTPKPTKDAVWKNAINVASSEVCQRIVRQLSGAEGVCGKKAVCVLSRNNAEVRVLANMLYASGVAVRGQGKMLISHSREWEALKDILALCDKTSTNSNVESVLWQLICRSSSNFARGVQSLMTETGSALDWALDEVVECCVRDNVYPRECVATIINGDPARKGRKNYNTKTMMALEAEVGRCGIVSSSIIEIINALRLSDPTETLGRLLANMRVTCQFMYKTARDFRLFDSIMEYFRVLSVQLGYDKMRQFVKATEQFEHGKYATDDRIEIRTIHGAKGGEWDTVYILMDDNIEFPNLEYIRMMSDNKISADNIVKYIDSERRLHYVAQTRASRRLYIVGEVNKLSHFVLESFNCGGTNSAIMQAALNNQIVNDVSIVPYSQELLDRIEVIP